jgi:hypothetical protein
VSEEPRDDQEEIAALADFLLAPPRFKYYVEAGFTPHLFCHPVHRDIFTAAAAIDAAGDPVDEFSIKSWLEAHGRSVEASFLFTLSGQWPTQTVEAIRARRRRLDELARARDCLKTLDHATRELREDPRLISNGFVGRHLTAIERFAPTTAAAKLLDETALLSLPEPGWLVQDRIPRGAFGVLVGEPGAGKTFAMIGLSVSVAAGLTWLGADVPPAARGPVLYASPEGISGLPVRLAVAKRAAGLAFDDPIGIFVWPEALNLLHPVSVDDFVIAARSISPRLVVVDTLARSMPAGDENSAKDMGTAIASLDRIRALGATTIALHHTNRAGTGERGSGALRGAADFMFELSRVDDRLTLTCSKQKDAAAFDPIAVELAPPETGLPSCVLQLAGTRPRVASSATPLTAVQAKALETLRSCFGFDGATSAEWEAACVPAIVRSSYYRARQVLIDRQLVVKRRNRYAATSQEGVE